jgi:hypothetical protein
MKASTFDELLSDVQEHVKKSDTNTRAAIKPEEMIETLEQKKKAKPQSQKKT